MNYPAVLTRAEPTRNLLILHTPVRQHVSDWLQVKERIEKRAPDIEVRIGTNGARSSVTSRWQVSRPSLVFSPFSMKEYRPRRGTVYAGRGCSKLEQIERLSRLSLPVPRTARLTRNLAVDSALWGEYVVAKPLRGGMGRDVYLVPTTEVAARYPVLTLNDTREMIIQPYIEHSEDGYPTEYRVLTLFGNVLYSARNRWGVRRRPLEEIAGDPRGIIASNDKHFGRVRTVWNDAEIIALGEQAHAAFPECPTLGVDLLRDVNSGRIYVMEVNPAGDTWHFSSLLTKNFFTPEHTLDLYAQFCALDRIAALLIQKTRLEAS
jgi:hypothetical protein